MRVQRRFPYIAFDEVIVPSRPAYPPKPSVTNTTIRVNIDNESVDRTLSRMEEITASVEDVMDALTDLARVERAYNDGQVPCIVCGVWSDPEAIAPNGVCETCILEALIAELDADDLIGCASSPSPQPGNTCSRRYI